MLHLLKIIEDQVECGRKADSKVWQPTVERQLGQNMCAKKVVFSETERGYWGNCIEIMEDTDPQGSINLYNFRGKGLPFPRESNLQRMPFWFLVV